MLLEAVNVLLGAAEQLYIDIAVHRYCVELLNISFRAAVTTDMTALSSKVAVNQLVAVSYIKSLERLYRCSS